MRSLLWGMLAVMASLSGCWCSTPELAECMTPSDCISNKACELGTCSDWICAYVSLDPGTLCDGGVDGRVCDESHDCVPCRKDGVKSLPEETDVDCGGPFGCPRCENGQGCNVGTDCKNGVCNSQHTCAKELCIDTVKNGLETDTDCGGPDCAPCADGRSCMENKDCVSGLCKDSVCCAVPCDGRCQTCVAGTGACTFVAADAGDPGGRCAQEGDACDGKGHCTGCVDQTKNGLETGIDCGGGVCPGCSSADAGPCNDGGDCDSCTCSAGKCVPTNCSDGDAGACETDTDCGGRCGATCGIGMTCKVKGDCLSNHCDNGKCAPP